MALSDTAEYWWKEPKVYRCPRFIHLKGFVCGHFHVTESKNLIYVDCHACVKHINETPELKTRLEQSIKIREAHKFRFGKCSCGSPLCERKNGKTGEKFLGCTTFPKCKNTYSITKIVVK